MPCAGTALSRHSHEMPYACTHFCTHTQNNSFIGNSLACNLTSAQSLTDSYIPFSAFLAMTSHACHDDEALQNTLRYALCKHCLLQALPYAGTAKHIVQALPYSGMSAFCRHCLLQALPFAGSALLKLEHALFRLLFFN